MLTVALDWRVQEKTGIWRYAFELDRHTAAFFSPDLNIVPVTDRWSSSNKTGRLGKALWRLADELVFMRNRLIKNNIDIFHCVKNHGIPLFSPFKIITTIHDLIPHFFAKEYSSSALSRSYYNINLHNTLMYSDAVIASSSFTRDELLKINPKMKERIYTIHLGCDPDFGNVVSDSRAREIMSGLGVERPFIFTIGGAEPRKNVAMLLALFDQNMRDMPCDLVILGGDWRGRRLAVPRNSKDRVHTFAAFSETELAAAYKSALFFVYPSIYEGFGLPLLEAMACGTPVIAHKRSSIPEVAGNAALLADMLRPDDCLAAIRKLLKEQTLRRELTEAGRERVFLFPWAKTARDTYDAYKMTVQ